MRWWAAGSVSGESPVRKWLARPPSCVVVVSGGGVVVVGDCVGSSERPGTVQSCARIDSSKQGTTLRQRRLSRWLSARSARSGQDARVYAVADADHAAYVVAVGVGCRGMQASCGLPSYVK